MITQLIVKNVATYTTPITLNDLKKLILFLDQTVAVKPQLDEQSNKQKVTVIVK